MKSFGLRVVSFSIAIIFLLVLPHQSLTVRNWNTAQQSIKNVSFWKAVGHRTCGTKLFHYYQVIETDHHPCGLVKNGNFIESKVQRKSCSCWYQRSTKNKWEIFEVYGHQLRGSDRHPSRRGNKWQGPRHLAVIYLFFIFYYYSSLIILN